jgi:hypothetical protein
MKKSLNTYLDHIDRDETVSTIAGLIRAGFSKGDIKDALPKILDDLLPFDLFIPGPIGIGLEAADRLILVAIVEAIFPLLYRRAERQAEPRKVTASVKLS